MPWIKKEDCNGCGICVEECSGNAISMADEKADINMQKCIRCGVCHDVCPEKAIRHDSETIPIEVDANIIKTKECMEACVRHLGRAEEAQKSLKRWIKHYNRARIVAEKTIARLQSLQEQDASPETDLNN